MLYGMCSLSSTSAALWRRVIEVFLVKPFLGRAQFLRPVGMTSEEVPTRPPHDATVTCLAISPDGGYVASGSRDTSVILWDASQQSALQEWAAHDSAVVCLMFSRDSLRLLSTSSTGHITIWEVPTGRRMATLQDHHCLIRDVVWSADDSMIAAGTDLGTVHIWSASTYELLHIMNGHERAVRQMAFSADGRWLLSCGSDYTCRVWDLRTGALQFTFPGNASAIFDRLGTRVAVATGLGEVDVWDLHSAQRLATLDKSRGPVFDIRFSADGSHVYSISTARLEICDASTGLRIKSLYLHTGQIRAGQLSDDGTRLVTVSKGGRVKLWTTSDGKSTAIHVAGHNFRPIRCLSVASDCTSVWFGTNTGNIHVLRLELSSQPH